MISPRKLAAVVAAGLVLQPIAASAQQACVSEAEASAIAIYSVPGLVEAVRLRCGNELSSSGYLARRGDGLIGRYAPIQSRVWPSAKAGLLKLLAAKAGSSRGAPSLDTFAQLPDSAVRPLVDALIVQEASPRIAPGNCTRLERVIEFVAPIDPEMAGSFLGAIAGLVNHRDFPICQPRRS